MALVGVGPISELGKRVGFDGNFEQTAAKLRTGGIASLVAGLRAQVDQMEAQRIADLGCKEKPDSAPCQVRVRYIYQVLREFPKEQVFAQVFAGFQLADSDPRVVAVNFVQPEHGLTAMRDYHLHMQMVDYMHRLYPRVHITLHAGELASGLVPPEGLRFHIREAIELGHAERIGHGVSVMYENDALGLLRLMKHRRIAVEINLTSNDLILGVRGADHPLPVYRKYGVPVVLSTDDEGVSRSHLTQEYQRAVLTYNLTYPDLKSIVRNSIEYSFLPPDEKARMQVDLEKRFERFEQTY
jgi:adenosine deaminase